MAIIGTRKDEILAILLTPPKITAKVKIVIIRPIIVLLKPKELFNERVIVLACTELNTNPKAIVIRIEKITPIHLFFSPLSI